MFLRKKQPVISKIDSVPPIYNDDQFKIPVDMPIAQEPSSGFVLVEAGCTLKANLNLMQPVRLLGDYVGNVQSSSEFLISRLSKYSGNLIGKRVRIFGSFEGEVKAESVELAAGAKFKGIMRASSCSIHKTCMFEGKMQVEK